MFPNFFNCYSLLETSRKKKNTLSNRDQNLDSKSYEADPQLLNFQGEHLGSGKQTKLSLRSQKIKPRTKEEMAGKFSNFSDLIQQVTASSKHQPPGSRRKSCFSSSLGVSPSFGIDEDEEDDKEEEEVMGMELVIMMKEVFDAVLSMKDAYVSLQEAHRPWDAVRLRDADLAVVGQLRTLGGLRDRYTSFGGGYMLKVLVAVEELKRDLKLRDMEVEQLKEKMKSMAKESNTVKKTRSVSRRKVCCSQALAAPAPELFEKAMSQVKEATHSFTSILLSHMRAAQWDIAAAVRSIEAATTTTEASTMIQTHHANAMYALQSYISRKVFQGFDHDSFYIDGSLSSLVNPDQYRRDCFTQYRDMKGMDPIELLDVLPVCNFGKFCSNKYLAVVHPKMEESFFGDLEQRQQVVQGSHPRSQFYRHFLELAKAVWLLHLLLFSVDPAPSKFEAARGAKFHPNYMESVVKFPGGVPSGQVVGFPMSPGFKLGNGSIIKAGVYLVSGN